MPLVASCTLPPTLHVQRLWLELATSAPPWCEVAVYVSCRMFLVKYVWEKKPSKRSSQLTHGFQMMFWWLADYIQMICMNRRWNTADETVNLVTDNSIDATIFGKFAQMKGQCLSLNMSPLIAKRWDLLKPTNITYQEVTLPLLTIPKGSFFKL